METAWEELARRDDRASTALPQELDNLSSLHEVNIELLTVAAQVSLSVREASRRRLVGMEWNSDMILRLGPLVAACFDDLDDLPALTTAFWKAASACAFEHNTDAAIRLIEVVVKSSPSSFDSVASSMNELLGQRKFKVSTKSLQLSNMLLSIDSETSVSIESSKIVDACIHTLVRELSSQAVLGADVSSLIGIFSMYHAAFVC